jgi:hypothetical protein
MAGLGVWQADTILCTGGAMAHLAAFAERAGLSLQHGMYAGSDQARNPLTALHP